MSLGIISSARHVLSHAWRHPLARHDRLGTLRRMASWQLRSRLDRSEHLVEWVNGAKLAVRGGQEGLTGNVYFGLHEFPDMAFFAHFLRPDDVFADIGANAGSYSVLAAKVAGAFVQAFEPVPETLLQLSRNVEANQIGDKVEIHAKALGLEEGKLKFTSDLGSCNRFATNDDADAITVPVSTADMMLAGKGVTAMKVDVEGAEHLVFGGAHALLAEPNLLAIQVESLMPGVREAVEGAGFAERWYDPHLRSLSPESVGLDPANRLFVRDEAVVAARLKDGQCVRFGRLAI